MKEREGKEKGKAEEKKKDKLEKAYKLDKIINRY